MAEDLVPRPPWLLLESNQLIQDLKFRFIRPTSYKDGFDEWCLLAIQDIRYALASLHPDEEVPQKLHPNSTLIYTHIQPQIQVGPSCGLVALAMVSSITPVPKSVTELMDLSVEKGFTLRGEMFSAKNLSIIAQIVLGDVFTIEHNFGGLHSKREEIIQDLLSENLLLVPYDSDRDHSPGRFVGHKAHWAVICGILVEEGKHYLIARQSKSSHLRLWLFEDLEESNENLIEVSPKRTTEGCYIFHDIKQTLSGHFITIKRKLT